MLDANKAGSILRKLFLYSKVLFFLCYISVMNYSVVSILIALQVSLQSLHPSSPYVLEFTVLYSFNMHIDASSPASLHVQKVQRTLLSAVAH